MPVTSCVIAYLSPALLAPGHYYRNYVDGASLHLPGAVWIVSSTGV
jgi:hypothetical protein